jgi:N-acetylmuramoyl-L-alanine amidase
MTIRTYKIAVFIAIIALVFSASFAFAKGPRGEYVIVIDPACGGDDTGVKLAKNMYEKDVTLLIAQSVKDNLATTKWASVRLTRYEDKKMSAAERFRFAESANADLFVSLSVNAGFGKNSSGYEVYFPGFKGRPSPKGDSKEIVDDMVRTKYLNDGVRFAQVVMKNMESIFPRKGRGLREAPILVLNELRIPAVVIELGFATNIDDRKSLMSKKVRNALAKALQKSIEDYFASGV